MAKNDRELKCQEIDDLKNRLSCVSSQLAFLIRETKQLVEYSETCLAKYGWTQDD